MSRKGKRKREGSVKGGHVDEITPCEYPSNMPVDGSPSSSSFHTSKADGMRHDRPSSVDESNLHSDSHPTLFKKQRMETNRSSTNAEGHHIADSARPLIMPDDVSPMQSSYTSSTSAVVTLQSAGIVLSSYLQSFGYPPQDFKQTTEFTFTPDCEDPKRSLAHCTIVLPPPCPLPSISAPGPGYRSKDLAKKHAQLALVVALVELGAIGPDFKPAQTREKVPSRVDRKYERMGQHIQRQHESSLWASDPVSNKQKVESFKRAMVESSPPSNGIPQGVSQYPYIPLASFWDSTSLNTKSLFPSIIELQLGPPFDVRNVECRKVCLVTSCPLPILNDTPSHTLDISYYSAQTKETIPAMAKLSRGKKLKGWKDGDLAIVLGFTQRLIRAHTQQPLFSDLASVKWLVVPMLPDWTIGTGKPERLRVRKEDIAWNEVKRATDGFYSPFTFNDSDLLSREIVDAVISTRSEFGTRSYVTNLRHDLTPSSPHPTNPDKSIHEVETAPKPLSAPNQPILEGERIHNARSGGFIAGMALPVHGHLHIPELCFRHTIAASVMKTTSALPSVLSELNEILLAHEFSRKIFSGSIRTDLALTAISAPTARPMRKDRSYERLELVGDTLLKFLVATYLLLRVGEHFCDWDQLNVTKQVMVSNQVLKKRLIEAGIVPYIRGQPPKPREWTTLDWEKEPFVASKKGDAEAIMKGSATDDEKAKAAGDACDSAPMTNDNIEAKNGDWNPGDGTGEPRLPLGGAKRKASGTDDSTSKAADARKRKAESVNAPPVIHEKASKIGAKDQGTKPAVVEAQSAIPPTQRLGDKTLADVAEALVAASYLSHDRDLDSAIQAMHILRMPIENFYTWEDVQKFALSSAHRDTKRAAPLVLLGYKFTVPENGLDAITVTANIGRRTKYMKLKILGDAVLDYFLVQDLFDKHPERGPAELTTMRHSRHGDACLAAFCATSGLIDRITSAPVELLAAVNQYRKAITAAKTKVDKAQDSSPRIEFWAKIAHVAFAGEIVNSVMGAILIDTAYDLDAVKTIFDERILPFFERYCTGPTSTVHPRSLWSQMHNKRGCSKVETITEEPNDMGLRTASIRLHDHIVAKETAETKPIAIRKACEAAIAMDKREHILDTICDCPRKKKGKS